MATAKNNPRALGNRKRILRYLGLPLRALGKVKDLYVDGMTRCASGSMMTASSGMGGGSASAFSRSSSRNARDDDFRELMRAASQGRLGNLNTTTVPRSQSVAIGRIDEDSPMEFAADLKLEVGSLYPRSRSCAVPALRSNQVGKVA